ncbi:MAG: hypothetical protein LBC11_00770 [Puniceicoccales bacterium]|nr:hypothetical protein [Puniceicoccales bacterium]
MTSLNTRKVEGSSAKIREFKETLGLLGGRNIEEVEHKMANKLHNYSNMTDCLKHHVKHAKNEEVIKTAYINGQKYKVKIGAKGSNGVVSITLMALDERGKTILEKTFSCSNNRIDETGKAALKKVSVRSNGKAKKTITTFEQEAHAKLANVLEKNERALEEVVGILTSPSPDTAKAIKIMEKCRKEILDKYPTSDQGNKDIGECMTHINNLMKEMESGGKTTTTAAEALKGYTQEFKAAVLGKRISNLMEVIKSSKVSKRKKLEAQKELAEIADLVLNSDNLDFTRAMGALVGGSMYLAVKHGIVALASKDKGKKSELMEGSRKMFDSFKNEGNPEAKQLAMIKLGFLYTAGFYEGDSLGKEIAEVAQKVVTDVSFLGIASLNGQGIEFAQKLQNELKERNLPTDGALFVGQQLDKHFVKHPKGDAKEVHKFSIGKLQVIVAEQTQTSASSYPYICILDKNGHPCHSDSRMGVIVSSEESSEVKLKQLKEMEDKLNQTPPDLVKLAESCIEIAISNGVIHPSVQNFTRPLMLADACRKQQKRFQKSTN